MLTYHEVTLDEIQLITQTLLLRIMRRTLNLIIIVIETSDMCARELCDFSCWSSNTTSYIQNPLAILQLHLCSEVMFVAGDGLVEWFTVSVAAEME